MENLVGYAMDDLQVPLELDDDRWAEGLARLNARAVTWCKEVSAALHSEIDAVSVERLAIEVELLGELPSLRLKVGPNPITRKVDKPSCIQFGSARYSGPAPADRHHGSRCWSRTRPPSAGGRADHR